MDDNSMHEHSKFPLISGNISIDLVNTEVVRWGQRYDLLRNHEDILDWLNVINQNSLLNEQHMIKAKARMSQVTTNLLEMRDVLRKQFEAIAENHQITDDFVNYLEEKIEAAPFTYKLIEHNLVAFPVGEIEDVLISFIAYDVLNLIADNKISNLKKCSNSECVLLFLDTSGRRKWCSMKICGNRKKVSKFQHKKLEEH